MIDDERQRHTHAEKGQEDPPKVTHDGEMHFISCRCGWGHSSSIQAWRNDLVTAWEEHIEERIQAIRKGDDAARAKDQAIAAMARADATGGKGWTPWRY